MTANETSPKRTLRVVGVPMDLGAGRRGVDMGPSAIRIAGVGESLRQL
ncbi:MAG TPA: arginase, partial [Planctomycetes bacterium]|nr:arginase [Planctomycetota bacterium]